MMGYCGACIMGYYEARRMVTLVYGSHEHVPISYGVVTLLEANGLL